MTCSLRSAEKGVISIWWSIIEYCSFLFHRLVNTRFGRVESRSVSWFASFFHHKCPMLGWSLPPLTPLGEGASTGHICCRLTDSSAASDLCVMKICAASNLCVMKICVWFLLCRNHPASTTQFSSSAERRAVLAALGESGWRKQACLVFALQKEWSQLLSLACAVPRWRSHMVFMLELYWALSGWPHLLVRLYEERSSECNLQSHKTLTLSVLVTHCR